MNKNKVVAHLVQTYLPITENWIYFQIINLRRYGSIILTPRLENQRMFPFEKIFYYKLPYEGHGRINAAICRLIEKATQRKKQYYIKVLEEQEAVLIHAHFGTEGYYNLDVKRTAGLHMVVTFYGYDMSGLIQSNPKWKKRYDTLFAECERFLVEGTYMRECLIDIGCPPEKVEVQHLGIDMKKIPFTPRVQEANEPVSLLISSGFREKKGIPYALEAFARAVKICPTLQLTVLGGARTEEEKRVFSSCQEIVRREGMGNKIRFQGFVSYDKYLLELNRAHIFLAPSITAKDGDTEGGAPIAVIEASASGMPVIATFHCDIPEVILNRKSGILTKERNIDELTAAILELSNAPETWPGMGQTGRCHVEKEYNIQIQATRMENTYDQVIGLEKA